MHKYFCEFKFTIAVLGALVVSGLSATPAHCQTWYDQKSGFKVKIVPDDEGFLTDVRARDVKASEIIEALAQQARFDIIVKDDAPIGFLDLRGVSLNKALTEITEASDLSYRVLGKTYVIEKRKFKAKAPTGWDIGFKNIPIAQLLKIIGEQSEIKIEVAPTVKGDFLNFSLTNEDVSQAIEKIARAADLSIAKTDDGVYRIGFDDAKTP